MRKIRYVNYYLALFALLVLASCSSKKSDPGLLMPKETGMLTTINMGSMHEKGKLAEFNKTQMFAKANGFISMMDPKMGKIVNQIVNDASQTGIDIKGDMNFFIDKSASQTGLILPMKDQAKFLTFVKSVSADYGVKGEPEKIDDYLAVVKEGALVAWNADYFILYGSMTSPDPNSLKAGFKKLINQKPEESFSSQEAYKKFMAGKKDISVYVDMDMYFNSINKLAGMTGQQANMNGLAELMKGCAVTYNAEFVNDEINVTYATELSDKMKKMFDLNKISKSPISDKLLKIVPANAIAVMTGGVNVSEAVKGYKELFKAMQGDIQNNPKTAEFNQIFAAIEPVMDKFDGEMIFSLNDFKTADKIANSDMNFELPAPAPVITVGLGVSDESAFDAILKNPELKLKESKGAYVLEAGEFNFFVVLKNKMLVVSSDPNIAEYVEKGECPNNLTASPYKAQLLKGNFGYFNLNFQTYPELTKQTIASNQFVKPIMDKMDIFEAITFEADVKNCLGKGKIQLKKTNTNSFYAMIQMIDKIVAAN
jgi:hypothetical protein